MNTQNETPAAHTALPWHVGMRPGPMIYGTKGEQVADCSASSNFDEENSANAALIVRAVNTHAELVEALRCIIAARDEAALVDDPALTLLDRAIDAAREALAKAKGGQP